MASDDTFHISRSQTQWEGYEYECRVCHARGGSIASITHDAECFVGRVTTGSDVPQQPRSDDPWVAPFSDSTVDVIQEIVRETTWIMTGTDERDSDVDTVQDVINGITGVRWTSQGSSNRIAVGLGRTSPYGEFHVDDHRGIVLKVDPNARFDEEYTPVSANTDELLTWEQAVSTNTSQYFADIITAAPDGMWLAMEYCIPISLRVRSEMNTQDMIYDDGGETYIHPLRGALKQAGWEDPDYKHGNIGLTDSEVPVVLDYGTGPDYTGPADADSSP